MTVGLTFRELLDEFGKAYENRLKKASVELMTSDIGLNPSLKQETERIKKLGITETQALSEAIYLQAIIDMIVKNNEAISKVISPKNG